MEYSLRKANINDFEIVFAIKKNGMREYIEAIWGWDEELQLKMAKESYNPKNISIIEVDNKPIGTFALEETNGVLFIRTLYLIKGYQSKGIGSGIIKDIIKNNPFKKIILSVFKNNQRAKGLYERLGFNVYEDGKHDYKMEYTRKICLNCGSVAEGSYCPQCGQKTNVQRYTLKHILHDFLHSFTHVDRGILFLMKELTLKPGTVAREYIEGKRKKYFNPMQYLLIGITVITFLSINLHLGTSLIGNLNVTGGKVESFKENFIPFFYKYYNIFQFITVPITALYSWIFFRKTKYNFAENLILNTFLIAHRHLIFLLVIPFLHFFPESAFQIINIHFFIWSIFLVYAYLQFFKSKHKIWAVLKSLLIIWLFIVTQALSMVAVFITFFYKLKA